MSAVNKKKTFLVRGFLFIVLLFLTIYLFQKRNQIQEFVEYGYIGLFLVSLLTNATIIFPIPGIVITTAMGALFNPLWVAIVAGIGAALGEITGYLAGFSGQFVVENQEWYQKVTNWMKKYGSATVFVMALIPNPIFDLTGIAAGVLKMPITRFFFWCLMGKILKMLFFAYTGSSVHQITGM
jgi:uncharacterized membrane protein YdjX (TVP38/TMEM64 family)